MAGLRFYAGSQLRTRRGYNLGMMCIIDHGTRHRQPGIAMLEELAGIVSDELEMRLEVRKALSLLKKRRIVAKSSALRSVGRRLWTLTRLMGRVYDFESGVMNSPASTGAPASGNPSLLMLVPPM